MSNYNKADVVAALMERLNNVNFPKAGLRQLMALSGLEQTALCRAIKNWNTIKQTPDEIYELMTDEMTEMFGEEFGLRRINIVAALPSNKYIRRMRDQDKNHATIMSDKPMKMLAKDSSTKEDPTADDASISKQAQEEEDARLCEMLSREEDSRRTGPEPEFPGIAARFNRVAAPAYARGNDINYFEDFEGGTDLESGAHTLPPDMPRASSDVPPFERRAPPPRDPNVMQFAKR